ncbi:hypothetical protein Tco_1160462, partial [Tanacetum coccineum]
MSKSTTNHAARVDRNLRSNSDSTIDHVWNGAASINMPCIPGLCYSILQIEGADAK